MALARFSGHVYRESRVRSYDTEDFPFMSNLKRLKQGRKVNKKSVKFAVRGANEELPKMHLLVSAIALLID